MVCGGDSGGKNRSKEIERLLRKDYAEYKRELKLLLLGTGESGKSTIIKQMRIIYGKDFQDEKQLAEFTPLIYRNILRSTKVLTDAMENLGIALEDESIRDALYELLDVPDDSYISIKPHTELYAKVWRDAGVKQAYARRNEFQLSDSTKYFFENLTRIAADGYIPNQQDVLRAREPTTGIHEYVFILSKAVFRMLDVGGQRSERRKWIHCFENITSIIFIAAASEFNQVLTEETETNRMVESITLFEQIINYYWFRETSFILFLNKQDLLREKIADADISETFPDFKKTPGNDPKNFEHVKNFVRQLYVDQKPETHDLYPHFTMATDTEQIAFVFDSVQSTILRSHLKDYSLF